MNIRAQESKKRQKKSKEEFLERYVVTDRDKDTWKILGDTQGFYLLLYDKWYSMDGEEKVQHMLSYPFFNTLIKAFENRDGTLDDIMKSINEAVMIAES